MVFLEFWTGVFFLTRPLWETMLGRGLLVLSFFCFCWSFVQFRTEQVHVVGVQGILSTFLLVVAIRRPLEVGARLEGRACWCRILGLEGAASSPGE